MKIRYCAGCGSKCETRTYQSKYFNARTGKPGVIMVRGCFNLNCHNGKINTCEVKTEGDHVEIPILKYLISYCRKCPASPNNDWF